MRPLCSERVSHVGCMLALIASGLVWALACSESPPVAVPEDAGAGDGGSSTPDGAFVRLLPTCPATPPSYQQTVATIIQERCLPCHFAGSTITNLDFSSALALAPLRACNPGGLLHLEWRARRGLARGRFVPR
jgi:hypothetical protein